MLPSWWLRHLWKSLGTNPSFAAMEHEIHLEPPSPVQCQERISFHRVSSAHSEQQPGWGQDFVCPHPIPTAESVLHLAGRFFPSGIDSKNHPRVANVSSTALQRFLPGFASPLPRTTREHGSRRTQSSLPVSGVSSRMLYFYEADFASHRMTKSGGLRRSPFSMSRRSTSHAPGKPLPSLLSMRREVPHS